MAMRSRPTVCEGRGEEVLSHPNLGSPIYFDPQRLWKESQSLHSNIKAIDDWLRKPGLDQFSEHPNAVFATTISVQNISSAMISAKMLDNTQDFVPVLLPTLLVGQWLVQV